LSDYRGRFAPSPTGPLHSGSLVAAVASWLDARAAGGEWLVRIEDVDTTRTVPGAADEILRTLEAFALHWDGEVVRQSERTSLYDDALATLRARGLVYRCRCSRREVADSGAQGPEGAVYPGTCRRAGLGPGTQGADRMLAPATPVEIIDRVQGRIVQRVDLDIGDFVLRRRDRLFAYQLAVVVDDQEQGITDVVRGADLLWSTPRQVALQRALGYRTPGYLHVPIATNAGGEKLSKQTHAIPVEPGDAAALRAALEFLGQDAGGSCRCEEILQHAARHWNVGAIPSVESGRFPAA
jgi:glutamyl-Q tRNA(Asp) synthetase